MVPSGEDLFADDRTLKQAFLPGIPDLVVACPRRRLPHITTDESEANQIEKSQTSSQSTSVQSTGVNVIA